ncbi:B120-like protein [Hibiscus syriacus]|uniref:Receptor-like serine/threonine-protein kinase n=1 Tax=Hibiscus syriacus TaxID=106335 RepID=A0A6A3C1R2_HIBSY|nr:G-type lectin S-receptor-like serine/threonine-protein kinase B120 [Hibiscus syriacus]KAE8723050.1 B120-like protein [Hibiscus syriacus]
METNSKNPVSVSLVSFIFLLCTFAQFCYGVDTIRQEQTVADGDTLVSENDTFELGFFSPENSTLRFFGIWYKIDVKTVVWVANRDSPISNRNGVLRIGVDGNLVVLNGNDSLVWSSNVSGLSNNSAAVLQNTGNLVLSNNESIGDTSRAHWQSFDEPTDTFLPGMRVPVNSAIGEFRVFRSWKSASDPSLGNYTMGVDPNGGPQIIIWDRMTRRWRSGQWNSVIFTGIPNMSNIASFLYGFKLSQPDENRTQYFTYDPSDPSDFLRFRLGWDGREQQLRWDVDRKTWTVLETQPAPDNICDLYNHCGNHAVCDHLKAPECNCLEGFRPRISDQWSRGDWSGGCERRVELQCQRTNGTNTTARQNGEPDGFKGTRRVKLPDSSRLLLSAMNIDACKSSCLGNCSCSAYAFVSGIGCMIWEGDLVDLQHLDQAGNLQFFYRIHNSELDGGSKISNTVIIIISVSGACLLVISIWLLWRYRKKVKRLPVVSSMPCCKDVDVAVFNESKTKDFSADVSGPTDILIDGNQVNGPELTIVNFSSVEAATKNFCEANRLGQGGFGTVYKGELPGGQEIAVKRLSGTSGQGLEEFKNEIILIAKLQHRNLVRLLGCSIEGEEKMLIYEYLPNKSLDYFLFDESKRALLDWRTRFSIIEGIARGLLYLHRDSRLRIIHRDLKASNILLDAEMNPKISDFGMARIFGGNQNEANTVRVVGTYGYMSPEYAMEGLFSVKSDVYSFGVLLLEIISGQRNTSFRSSNYTSLIAYAWSLWNEDKAMELVDPLIQDSCSPNVVLKCIHLGMLCVQDSAMNRPTMAAVVLMLESEAPTLPMPKQPTYTSMSSLVDADYSMDMHETASASSKDVTVTMVDGR